MNILFLTLHTFSLTGGIEKVGRAFSKVLSDLNKDKKIGDYFVSSMYDDKNDKAYLKSSNFEGFKGNRILFSFSTLQQSISFDTIVLSHINLLVFGRMIKKIAPKKRIILLAHGIEVWGEISKWKLIFLQTKCELWAVSEFTKQQLIAKEVPAAHIKILNNCLDPFNEVSNDFEKPQYLLDRYKLKSTDHILFTLSRLSSAEQYKGYDQVLTVLKKIIHTNPNLHYILAGKADELEEARINAMIKTNGLKQRVTLAGFLNENEVSDHYRLADLYLMPSKGEGFGISFIEAAAAGCAIIAGNKDGSVDALLNGELGELIDPDDLRALTNAIHQQLDNKKEKSKIIQRKCMEHFSYEKYKENVLELLTSPPRPSDKTEQVLLEER